nr:hypothetical protein [Tanacetum cinerariifolium]
KDGFHAYWLGSERVIPNKEDLKDYWIEISSDRDFLGPTPSYVYIRDPAWVAPRPEKQPDATAGALKAAKDALFDKCALADPAPMQAPQPPYVARRTMPQRIARLEQEVHEL